MLKNILMLNGIQELNKKEQKQIAGGFLLPISDGGCSCVFSKGGFGGFGPRGGILALEILDPCNAQTKAECESRPNGRVVPGGF